MIIASLLLLLLAIPLASGADPLIRLTSGMLTQKWCERGDVYDPDGRPLSNQGWDDHFICTTVLYGLFTHRTAYFAKTEKHDGWTETRNVTLAIDSRNRVTTFYPIDALWWLLWIILVTATEASPLLASPGKRFLGLKVTTPQGEKASVSAVLTRNLLKNIFVAAYTLFILVPGLVTAHDMANSTVVNQTVVFPAEFFSAYLWSMLVIGLIAGLAQIILLWHLFFPWRSAGRGLYDRLAGTIVIR